MQNDALNPEILEEARKDYEEKEKMASIPSGYIPVELSTRGLIGAPSLFHIRNFSAEDLGNLGLADQEDLPVRLISVLDDLIFEEGISVKDFHQKEVVELLLLLYETFYQSIFTGQTWTLTDDDKEFIADQCGGNDTDEYNRRMRAYDNGEVKPQFDIDISKLEYHDIPDDFKTHIRIDRKLQGNAFSAVFSLPKFGDFVILKSFMETIFKEEDKRFARLGEMIKFKRDSEQKLLDGKNIDIHKVPNVPKEQMDQYKEYETKRNLFAITASKALYLSEFDGKDVSKYPLEKKLELAQDARLDYSTFKLVQDQIDKMQFGLKEEITVMDPILNKVVQRKYSFQLTDLLTAIRDTPTAETSITLV